MYGREPATQQFTPDLVRVVLGEGDLDEFGATDFTDADVDIAIRPPGAPDDEVFDPS